MSGNFPSDRLVELVDAVHGETPLSEADAQELEALLTADEKAREYYVLNQELHTMLEVDKDIRLQLAADLMPENVIPLPGVDVSEVLSEPETPKVIAQANASSKTGGGYRMATSLVAMISGLAVLIWIYTQVSEFVEKTTTQRHTPALVDAVDQISFHHDVLPILRENCFKCHGVDSNQRKADLRLDIQKYALGGDKPAIVPGQPSKSEMIARITSLDPDYRMPPSEADITLTPGQISTLTKWVEQGADYGSEWSLSELSEADLWLARLCD